MIAGLLQLVGPFILSLAIKFVESYFKKRGADEEDWLYLQKFTAVMRKRHLLYAEFQLEIEKQAKEGSDYWDRIEERHADAD